jgi:hypothetical protein
VAVERNEARQRRQQNHERRLFADGGLPFPAVHGGAGGGSPSVPAGGRLQALHRGRYRPGRPSGAGHGRPDAVKRIESGRGHRGGVAARCRFAPPSAAGAAGGNDAASRGILPAVGSPSCWFVRASPMLALSHAS